MITPEPLSSHLDSPIRPPNEFVTARLRLRRPEPADAPLIFERWTQDPEVTRYLVWSPHQDVSESEAHIRRCIDDWNSGQAYVWFLEDPISGELIGSLAARHHHGINVGYLLARDSWGRGYMVEALAEVTRWYLSQPGIERVWATCDVENAASARVLEKAGFELEGILRRWDVHPNTGGGRRDARCYSKIRE